jgi:nicotinamidase/pyrazinamidase
MFRSAEHDSPLMKSALILVDLQNDFLPGGALAVPHGDEVIPLADELQRRFDLVVATKDWHPSDHGSFAANHPGKKPGDRIILDGIEQILWPTHCVQNTNGASLRPLFDTSRIAHVFHKGTERNIDSYSTFFDNAHRDTPVLLITWRSAASRKFILWVWRWTTASNTVRSTRATSD